MRNPNGYGAVIKLGGKRRKPWAVRVTTGKKYDPQKDRTSLVYKYIGYAETRKEANMILAEYNTGMPIKDNLPRNTIPAFEDIWDQFFNYKFDTDEAKAGDTARNYKIAFNRFSSIHHKKMTNISAIELQDIFDQYRDKSKSTVRTMKTVINQMYRYAKRYYDIDDISSVIDARYTDSEEQMHKPFTNEELNYLWKISDQPMAQFVLMMCYTGVRPQEFVKIETANVHLDEWYMVCGLKTDAGKNRIIPIHTKIRKFFELNYHPEKKYLINKSNFKELTKKDRRDSLSYSLFNSDYWTPFMDSIGFDHKPHDPRHTFASLMDAAHANKNALKEIMGHEQTDDSGKFDITNAVYIHRTIEQLREEIEKI